MSCCSAMSRLRSATSTTGEHAPALPCQRILAHPRAAEQDNTSAKPACHGACLSHLQAEAPRHLQHAGACQPGHPGSVARITCIRLLLCCQLTFHYSLRLPLFCHPGARWPAACATRSLGHCVQQPRGVLRPRGLVRGARLSLGRLQPRRRLREGCPGQLPHHRGISTCH